MTESYTKRLIDLGRQLQEQLQVEEDGEVDAVPIILASKINYICGYIEALSDKNTWRKNGKKKPSKTSSEASGSL